MSVRIKKPVSVRAVPEKAEPVKSKSVPDFKKTDFGYSKFRQLGKK